MSKWKPKPPEVRWEQPPRSRSLATFPCVDCGQPPRGFRAVIATQVNWMRGDDEVEHLCISCAIRRGIKPDRAVCRLLFADNMTQDEQLAIAERFQPPIAPQGDVT